jgi:hypothetical protein
MPRFNACDDGSGWREDQTLFEVVREELPSSVRARHTRIVRLYKIYGRKIYRTS